MTTPDKCPACPEPAHDGQACSCGCVGSAVLRRLIAEVRNDRIVRPGQYDRVYNRHNRSL